jgi:hypothetical protein
MTQTPNNTKKRFELLSLEHNYYFIEIWNRDIKPIWVNKTTNWSVEVPN